MAKIKIVLTVEAEPFTEEELKAEGFEGEEAEVEPIDVMDAHAIAEGIASHCGVEEYAREMLAGSACFVHILGADVVSYEVLEEEAV